MKTPEELQKRIQEKASKNENDDYGLSRILATFDWDYKDKGHPENSKYWDVEINDWKMPWNLQLPVDENQQKRVIKKLSWAEQPQTINEVGSTYTIQGFDLNYSGVIIGPSVKFRNGKIIFDPDASSNKKAIRNRKLSDGTMQKFGQKLLQNEFNVLMTRGENGLYIYAVDDKLRKALLVALNRG